MKTAQVTSPARVETAMHTPVIELPAYMTMTEAAELFLSEGISGAPVVDDSRRCVGVLSAIDFVRWMRTLDNEAVDAGSGADYEMTRRASGAIRIDRKGRQFVTEHMSQAVQTITPEDTLSEAARRMKLAHVHRLPVVDENARPVGWISALDLLAGGEEQGPA